MKNQQVQQILEGQVKRINKVLQTVKNCQDHKEALSPDQKQEIIDDLEGIASMVCAGRAELYSLFGGEATIEYNHEAPNMVHDLFHGDYSKLLHSMNTELSANINELTKLTKEKIFDDHGNTSLPANRQEEYYHGFSHLISMTNSVIAKMNVQQESLPVDVEQIDLLGQELTLKQEDIDKYPELKDHGLKVGDKIEIGEVISKQIAEQEAAPVNPSSPGTETGDRAVADINVIDKQTAEEPKINRKTGEEIKPNPVSKTKNIIKKK